MLINHLERVQAGLFNIYGLANIDEWITKHTYLNGKPYSFLDHEFQQEILRDDSQTSIIVKCAQIGLSELAYRWAVASCCVVRDFTVIYTFPSANDAEKNNKTRIDPMIAESPELARLVSKQLNNSEVKQFGVNSFLFFKGTRSETQALSTPANAIIHDEYDKSDVTQASVYVSRLQHKPHKIRKIFSTPTVPGYGVSKEAKTSRRMQHISQCEHCNHWFLPDYFKHIVIPGYDGALEELTKENIHLTNWREAYMVCPKCGRDPNLHHERQQFVCENVSESHEAKTWYISPFSAPKILTPSYMVNASTKFERFSEFKNQVLGLAATDTTASLSLESLEAHTHNLDLTSGEVHCIGADMGLVCRITVSRMAATGEWLVVHYEKCHYMAFEERINVLSVKYNAITQVYDSQPYTDLITRMCKGHKYRYGAMFTRTQGNTLFTVSQPSEESAQTAMAVQLLKINRSAALDSMVAKMLSPTFVLKRTDETKSFHSECLSMQRVQKFTTDGELTYLWEKTDGEDHYFMSTLYSYLACLLNTQVTVGAAATGMPLVHILRRKKLQPSIA
jgi:hypothetical protein